MRGEDHAPDLRVDAARGAALGEFEGAAHRGGIRHRVLDRRHPVSCRQGSGGCIGDAAVSITASSTAHSAADTCRLPSGLSPSVPEFHRFNRSRSTSRPRRSQFADCHRRFGITPTPEHVSRVDSRSTRGRPGYSRHQPPFSGRSAALGGCGDLRVGGAAVHLDARPRQVVAAPIAHAVAHISWSPPNWAPRRSACTPPGSPARGPPRARRGPWRSRRTPSSSMLSLSVMRPHPPSSGQNSAFPAYHRRWASGDLVGPRELEFTPGRSIGRTPRSRLGPDTPRVRPPTAACDARTP